MCRAVELEAIVGKYLRKISYLVQLKGYVIADVIDHEKSDSVESIT